MMSNLIEIDEIISNLKATIRSNKGGVQLSCIESDYCNIIGEPIPYQKLGYNSLVEFLEPLKVFKIKYNGSNPFVCVVSDGKTQHLEQMINKQKSKTKRKYSKLKLSLESNKKLNNSYKRSMQNSWKKKKQPDDYFEKNTSNVHPSNKYQSRLSKKSNEKKVFFKNDDKPKVLAQNRLLKYVKKDINQIQELKNKTMLQDSLELSELFQKKCSIQETAYKPHIQPTQGPTYCTKQFNLEMNVYKVESKCKKVVTVTAVLSPSIMTYVVVGDKNTNATKTILNNLDLFNEFPFLKEIVTEKLLYKKCIMITSSVITDPMFVTLYDLETYMNLNDEIIKKFLEKVTPNITSGDGFDTTEAKLVSFEDGYCYLQFNQNLIKSLENIFSTDQYSGPCLKKSKEIDYKNTYLAYYGPNIKGRVKVMLSDFISNNQVKVFFIDYGCIKTVEVDTLIDLFKINNLLVQIPCQAVKVTLHLFPPKNVTRRTEEELFNILGTNCNVLIFKLDDFKGPIPCVQLWNISYPNTFINMVLYKRLQHLKQ